ncbi:MAG: hypothetical protein AAGJ81_01615 [Verrucomicrobiota bacterium]
MNSKPIESDWKQFRSMVDTLRERYLEETNQRLRDSLLNPTKTPTERFWDTHEEIREEARVLTDCLDKHSRSKMYEAMVLMLHHGMMTEDDLEVFSEDLQEKLIIHLRNWL